MAESLVFTVEIGHEMLRALRKVEDSLQINYFSAGGGNASKRLREKFEHPAVIFYLGRGILFGGGGGCFHGIDSG